MLLVEDTGAGFRRLEIFGKNKLWMKGDNLKSGFHKIIHFIESFKHKKSSWNQLRFKNFFFCDPDRIQTCNLLIRSQMLYSVEPRGLHQKIYNDRKK